MRDESACGWLSRAGPLPALAVGQWVLLLTRDKGGTPHRTAVAVPEPAHGRRRRVLGGAEAMVRLGFCCER